MCFNNKNLLGNGESGLLPDLWIPVIEVKIGTALFLSRSLWWRNKDGSFFREEWNEDIFDVIEFTRAFQEQETRNAAQTFLDLLRPEYQAIFGHSMTFVYCQRAWDILADYGRQETTDKKYFSEPQLSTVYLFNPSKNRFDPLIETKPM